MMPTLSFPGAKCLSHSGPEFCSSGHHGRQHRPAPAPSLIFQYHIAHVIVIPEESVGDPVKARIKFLTETADGCFAR